MPLFECKVSHTLFAADLQTKQVAEIVYVEAKNESEAKQKAGRLRNWSRSAATFGNKSSSFLITVWECRRVDAKEGKTLSLVAPAPAQFRRTPC